MPHPTAPTLTLAVVLAPIAAALIEIAARLAGAIAR